MSQVSEQKCPNCGGATRFDPAKGKYVCDYCGTVFEIGAAKPSAPSGRKDEDELDFSHLLEQAAHADAVNLPVYRCVSCGAEVIAPPEQAALSCPYCGNNIVLTDRVTGKLRPDGIIPFRIESKDLPAAVRNFYKGKKLLPKGFFSAASMGLVTGVYLPFWVFSGQLSGTMNFNAERVSSTRHGDYIYTTTKTYRLVRDASLAFSDIPVDASTKTDDRLMDSLEPFDLTQVRDFDMRYLAGFTADRFDQSSKEIAPRVENRMRTSMTNIVQSNVAKGYTSVRGSGSHLRSDMNARYILFPVYIFDIRCNGKNYHYAVNGQTGKVTGELPDDRRTKTGYFLRHAGVFSGALILASFLRYFLGY